MIEAVVTGRGGRVCCSVFVGGAAWVYRFAWEVFLSKTEREREIERGGGVGNLENLDAGTWILENLGVGN